MIYDIYVTDRKWYSNFLFLLQITISSTLKY